MKKTLLIACAVLLFSGTASAAGWQSLGRVNALTATPDPQQCEQRVINHYWSSKPIYYPDAVNVYSANNIEFVFDRNVSALRTLVSNAPANSRFKTAVDAYNAQPAGAKSLFATISAGQFPGVSIRMAYVDANGLTQGLGWGIVSTELQFYELQQRCPI